MQVIRSLAAYFALWAVALCANAQSSAPTEMSTPAASGPVRLRQPQGPQTLAPETQERTKRPLLREAAEPDRAVAQPRLSEFEEFVQNSTGIRDIRRFGAELLVQPDEGLESAPSLVPPDYALTPGDEVIVSLWGSVDADLRLAIDRTGRITIPRVGPVMLAGVRYADAPDVIRRRVAQTFKNFDLSISLGQLRGIRIYVTGFVDRPGSYTAGSLSSVIQGLLKAGGPSAAGSFRHVELRRVGQPTITYDLYDLLLKGDRSTDRTLQSGDVIYVGAVGRQVAIVGSVNRPAIFELKDDERVGDVVRMAGGFTAVADQSRLAIERLRDRMTVRIAEMSFPEASDQPLSNGDLLRAFSAVQVALPQKGQAMRVRIEGEVARPGEYVLAPTTTVTDALIAAGGMTSNAFVYGTEFTRESVRRTQQENYDRALRDLEVEFTKAATTQRTTSSDEASAQAVRASNTSRLIERLKDLKPTGRIVFQLEPGTTQLPDLALQDGDRIYIPARPTTVGVFGSVYNGGSYLHVEGRTLARYMALAGGPTRGADVKSVFVIRANGTVVSTRQSSGWFGVSGFEDIQAQPGDTIFVPEEINKTTFLQNAKDWTQILYQFGVGIAAIKTLGK